MKSEELRQKFLKFFEEKGHKVLPSSSLVPENDPSVLLTTAGMQQFKKWFAGFEKPDYPRVVTIQKCVRTSDIEEVGDETHLTFFEMLGNFSFDYPDLESSYYKQEAIEFAWEFLTSEKWLGVNKENIYATYFDQDKVQKAGHPAHLFETDNESKEILEKIKGLKDIRPQGEDNFWTLGTVGSPGGPTVEFYINDVEIWNLVFNEAIWKGDHWHWENVSKGVDTGMGLERLVTTINGKTDVYKTDLFEKPINKIREVIKVNYEEGAIAIRRIVDHRRAINELIKEGIKPGKNKREYVLRVLLRVCFIEIKYLMEQKKSTESEQEITLEDAIDSMFTDWSKIVLEILPEDSESKTIINEEYKNYLNLKKPGIKYLKRHIGKPITGKIIFEGKDTFGLSSEGTVGLWDRLGHQVDPKWQEEYNEALRKHQEVSKVSSSSFKGGLAFGGEMETKYHTASHLLHRALKIVLGDHVKQAGSNITAERMRFDFTHSEKMTPEETTEVEKMVNEEIKKGLEVKYEEMSLDEAKASGAVGIFDHKYGDKVKVYSIGDFSREICGGPHVNNTSELGHFKIKKEESSSSGVRRIKAILQ